MKGLTGNVLVTGGAGFLARGIYRRARAERWDCRFTAFSRDDAKHARLQAQFPEVRTVLGDVAGGDEFLLDAVFVGHDAVIHAAASKYVDRAETAAWDTIRTNVWGSQWVAEAAIRAGVERVVAISTDKACGPVNIYGQTKAVMERIFQEADRVSSRTRFTVVRYGNVIGSTGSVVPLFRRQLEETGRVQVTDPKMTRFWMGIDEAVDLVVDALDPAYDDLGGHVLIPSPRALSLGDLVRIAIGVDPGVPLPEDIVEIVGIRPGEKRHETLIHLQESVRACAAAVAYTGQAWMWALSPAGSDPSSEPFDVVYDVPPRWMMPIAEMVTLMADAETI